MTQMNADKGKSETVGEITNLCVSRAIQYSSSVVRIICVHQRNLRSMCLSWCHSGQSVISD